jgi:hypothetical protein
MPYTNMPDGKVRRRGGDMHNIILRPMQKKKRNRGGLEQSIAGRKQKFNKK